jgi:hypothetical protein
MPPGLTTPESSFAPWTWITPGKRGGYTTLFRRATAYRAS